MEQKKEQQKYGKQLSFSEQLIQHIANEPFDVTDMFGRAAQSYPQNRRKQRIRTAIAVVIGIVIGALAMHILSSPERWIRL